MAGPTTFTDSPLAKQAVPIAPPSAIVVCWAASPGEGPVGSGQPGAGAVMSRRVPHIGDGVALVGLDRRVHAVRATHHQA
jgi:hypothetical protein